MQLRDRLHEKGWSKDEIDHALYHLAAAQQAKHPAVRITEALVYWLFVLALVVCVAAMATFLFPLLAFLPASVSLVTVAVLGAVFGMLFSHTLQSIESLAPGHHVLIMVMTFAVAEFATIFVGVTDLLLGVVFGVLFCVQYAHTWWSHARKPH
jgi:hypothetical protein